MQRVVSGSESTLLNAAHWVPIKLRATYLEAVAAEFVRVEDISPGNAYKIARVVAKRFI